MKTISSLRIVMETSHEQLVVWRLWWKISDETISSLKIVMETSYENYQ